MTCPPFRAAAVCLGLTLFGSIFFCGCKTVETATQIGTAIGVATGAIDTSQAESIQKGSAALTRSFQDITPEQEYYIGRTVGAVVVNRYAPYDHPAANRYLNLLGQTLAQASDLPETFIGYHFLILDSDEINAFASPGGFIFVTRGLINCCQSETALAAVLAHEIGHIQLRHGLQAIKRSRITTALTTLALEGSKSFGGPQLASLTRAFEGSISDITATMIQNGYSRVFEKEADMAAVTILDRCGYNPTGLIDMLRVMQTRLVSGGSDFAKTHPAPRSRIAEIQKQIGADGAVKPSAGRQNRFARFKGDL